VFARESSGAKSLDDGALRSRTSKLASATGAGVKTRWMGKGGGGGAEIVDETGRGGGTVVRGGRVGFTKALGLVSRLGATFGGGLEPAGWPSASRKRRIRSSSVWVSLAREIGSSDVVGLSGS
jgi:hypothetical protein